MSQEQFKNQHPTDLSETVALAMLSRSRRLANTVVNYQELLMRYTCAMKEIRTKFEVLNTEYNVRFRRNPIVSINTRLKQTASIVGKLERLGLEFSPEAIEQNLNDIAGVRVICAFPSDIYQLEEAFLKQDDIRLVERKDYIANPKSNGYRSLHLIVEIPIFLHDHKRLMRVEVQFRTISMDWWASLEHKIRYKKGLQESDHVDQELFECAKLSAELDSRMEKLQQFVGDLYE